MESKQHVPDFLEAYKPMEEAVTFDDDTDDEADKGDDSTNGGAWEDVQMDDSNEVPSSNWGSATDSAWGGAPKVTDEVNVGGASWD